MPMRNRAVPAVMAFVAQAAGRRVMCYATANVLRDEADSMAVRSPITGRSRRAAIRPACSSTRGSPPTPA